MIHARENLSTFLISWLIAECAQDDIGKRAHFLPVQAPDPAEFGEAIAQARQATPQGSPIEAASTEPNIGFVVSATGDESCWGSSPFVR